MLRKKYDVLHLCEILSNNITLQPQKINYKDFCGWHENLMLQNFHLSIMVNNCPTLFYVILIVPVRIYHNNYIRTLQKKLSLSYSKAHDEE